MEPGPLSMDHGGPKRGRVVALRRGCGPLRFVDLQLGDDVRDGRREAIALGLRLWIPGALIWAVGHTAAVWAAKRDPQFVDVVRRHLRYPAFLGV